MYGMDPDPELEKTLRKAVDLITKAQSPSGGWRYQPNPGDQDLSVTVMQIVALRVANNAEIPYRPRGDRQGDRLCPVVRRLQRRLRLYRGGRTSAALRGPSNAQKPGTQNRLGKTGNPL